MNNSFFLGNRKKNSELLGKYQYGISILRLIFFICLTCRALDSYAYAIPVGDFSCEFTDYSDEVSLYYNGDRSNLTHIEIPEKLTIRYRPNGGSYYTEREFTVVSIIMGNCPNLRTVVLPNSIKKIPTASFKNCPSLVSVNIPKNITEIGYDAFSGCLSLTSINIPAGVTYIGKNAFFLCI